MTPSGESTIEFIDVAKTYPDGTTAVHGLSMRIAAGSFTAFVGPSGCGKTTSMRMVNRMVEPSTGSVRVNGQNVTTLDPVRLRRSIGYVIQSAGLLPHLRIIDNVATVPVLQGVSRREARRAAGALLERVGLDPTLGARYPAQLSGGQRQRVGVARALAADPSILLMDEPFSAVDPVVREELQNEMIRLQAELHKTVVFVTHDIDEALRLADRIAVFGHGGTLAQFDEPKSLLAHPADDFVADFVGRDRGYRILQFESGSALPLTALTTSTEDEIDALSLPVGDWRMVMRDGRPFGWIDAAGIDIHRGGGSLYESCSAGGSLFVRGGTLRQALDAALSSPSGIGVVVDDAGAVIGGIRPADVIAEIERERRGGL